MISNFIEFLFKVLVNYSRSTSKMLYLLRTKIWDENGILSLPLLIIFYGQTSLIRKCNIQFTANPFQLVTKPQVFALSNMPPIM